MTRELSEFISEYATQVADEARERYEHRFHVLSSRCESPIEKLLLAVILANEGCFADIYISTNLQKIQSADNLLFYWPPGPDSGESISAIYSQIEIGPYRADFYIEGFVRKTGDRWLRMVIECDGHDFHEKTKQQAVRDKKRDRWFQIRGITILRFTGSEIWNDPQTCIDQIWEAYAAAYERQFHEEPAN